MKELIINKTFIGIMIFMIALVIASGIKDNKASNQIKNNYDLAIEIVLKK